MKTEVRNRFDSQPASSVDDRRRPLAVGEMPDAAQADQSMETLNAFYRRVQKIQEDTWKKHADVFPTLRMGLANLARPARETFRNARRAVRATGLYGRLVAERTGVSRATQLLQQVDLYRRHRVPADCYYALGMYEEGARKKARYFLGDRSTSLLLHHLGGAAPETENRPLHDKAAFLRHCREYDLAAVPGLAVFRDGRLETDCGNIREALPGEDLFSKPLTAFLGKGARRWICRGDGVFETETGEEYSSREVFGALKKQSRSSALLLQPRVVDHPVLQELTGVEGPSTLRIVTLRRPDESPEYFAAFLTTPLEEVSAPTFTGGTALAARVDSGTGQLGRPRSKHPQYLLGEKEHHPGTGKPMMRFELPGWSKAKSLALNAHRTVPHVPCVGWDIVLTPDGPRLLEGNADCSATLVQITHQTLLGLTPLPEILNVQLQRMKWTEES